MRSRMKQNYFSINKLEKLDNRKARFFRPRKKQESFFI